MKVRIIEYFNAVTQWWDRGYGWEKEEDILGSSSGKTPDFEPGIEGLNSSPGIK